MIRKYKSQLLLILLCLMTCQSWAQTSKPNFILETNETGTTRNYVARNYIVLKSGFSYTATGTINFSALIDTTLTFTITSIPNPIPGDTTNHSGDETYTPGGSFSNDVTEVPSGLATRSSVSGESNDTSYIYPVLWLKTVPVTNNLNGAYKWKDVTTNHTPVLKYSVQGAGHGTEYIVTRDKVQTYNFNPAIDLSYEDISKELLIRKSNLAQATIIGVWGPKADYKKDRFLFSVNGRKNESVLFTKNYVVQADSTKTDLIFGNSTTRNFLCQSNGIDSDTSKFKEKSLRVGTYYKANKPDLSMWGEPQKAVISLGYKFNAANVNNTSVFNAQWQDSSEFKGYTPELLVFDRQLSPLDCRKYESYLAIKYGITLDTSYFSAQGNIIWEYDATYKNRITGYGREDALGLNQKTATTSYEETPFYSNQTLYDSFEANNSYGLPSSNRLLVMGCQPGNTMDDGKYVIFGDNNLSIANADSIAQGFTGTMSRKWLVCTNQILENNDTILSWENTGLAITRKNTFKCNIKSTPNTSASIVTEEPLKAKDGYFTWTVEQEYGPVIVKFGKDTAGLTPESHDYGYKISEKGDVFSIQKGIVNTNCLFTVEKGQRLEVEKNGRVMYLRVDGVRYKNTEFVIDSTKNELSYYGAISIGSNSSSVQLTDFRHGGFVDTGHKVELSYLPQRASAFANYRERRTSLIIDRSGNGNFSGDVDSYSCDEVDERRSKIIFNNIFWDTDMNGKDAFTFGTTDSPVLRSAKIDISEETPEPEKKECKDNVQIYYKNINDLSTVTVKVEMEEPSKATIMVYDLLGKRLEMRVMSENSNVRYTDVRLPGVGIYIIKVTTRNMQYSQEVISKM